MVRKWGRWLVVLACAAALSLLAWATAAADPTSSQSAPPVSVQVSVGTTNETVVYSITLQNTTSSDIAQVFLAGVIPQGASTVDALSAPPGSWFRGFEAAGTPLHAAVWLADGITANSVLGPFVYRVEKAQATDLGAFAWVRWLHPEEGSIRSADAGPGITPVMGMGIADRFHTVHSGLGLPCATCHVQSQDYRDPMAQVFYAADQRPCLPCHGAGSVRPFFGDNWRQGSVTR